MPAATLSQPELPAQVRKGAKSFYHPELDVLRFAAFCGVFLTHTFESHRLPRVLAELIRNVASAGMFGVTLFFLLSSYLITTLLLREFNTTGRLDLKSFYIRRSLRIWPLYFFFLALCILVLPALGWPPFSTIQKISFSLFAANWSMMFLGIPSGPAASLWSVSVEEQFYLFWPLGLALFGVGRIRKMAFVLLAIATLTRCALVHCHNLAFVWINTLVQLDPIAVGALLAYAFRNGLPEIPSPIRTLLVLAGIALPIAALAYCGNWGWGMLLTYPAATLGAAAILTGTLSHSPARWLRGGPLVYLGKISYGLYVYHSLMVEVATKVFIHSRVLVALSAFGATVAAAALSYQLLERPFLRLKHRFEHIRSRPA